MAWVAGFAIVQETERIRRFYDREAERYDQGIRIVERLLLEDGRDWVCSQARGDVLEIAAGTGRNFPHYPADVRLTAQDLSEGMLGVARRYALALGRPVHLLVGDAEALGFKSARCDTVVCTLSLCTIPDDRRAIAEAHRVLRPGGLLLLLEHVRSPLGPVRAIQRLLDPLAIRCAADHLLRDPVDHVLAAGFIVERLERRRAGVIERLSARKPTA